MADGDTSGAQPSVLEAVVGALGEVSSGSVHASQLNATDELLTLSHALDDHAQTLKRQVLESVSLVRASLEHRHAEEVAQLRARMEQQEARSAAQLEEMDQRLRARTDICVSLERGLKHRAAMFFVQGVKLRRRGLAHSCYLQWRAWARRRRFRETVLLQRERASSNLRTQRVFSAWRAESLRHRGSCRELRLRQHYDTTLERERNDHSLEVSQLQAEITGLRARVAEEVEHRGQLEERLKIAFMRGVCQLNLEAMQVLRRSDDVAAQPPEAAPPADVDLAALLARQMQPQQPFRTPAAPEPVAVDLTGVPISAIDSGSGGSEDRSAEHSSVAALAAAAPAVMSAAGQVRHVDTQRPAAGPRVISGVRAPQVQTVSSPPMPGQRRRVQVAAADAEEIIRHDRGRGMVRAVPPPQAAATVLPVRSPQYTGVPLRGAQQRPAHGRGTPARTATPLGERVANPQQPIDRDGGCAPSAPIVRRPLAGMPSPSMPVGPRS
eukprot:TRINITY_DN11902_c0_g1_i1.p1 TRINITY_DN11902_c0_g1~~TRINITY_DN11902_c0_g1_i1.p1  ORF type:complete len:495 (+),score=102.92 TRINITY_DN11902_c0_g1_i1:56-1540(+)